jgi:hypothetical protein
MYSLECGCHWSPHSCRSASERWLDFGHVGLVLHVQNVPVALFSGSGRECRSLQTMFPHRWLCEAPELAVEVRMSLAGSKEEWPVALV